MLLISPSLGRLAALVGEMLGGPDAGDGAISREICTLALRHQVGPFLYSLAARGRHEAPSDVLAELRRSYDASARRRQAALAVLERVAQQFSRRCITWMAVKGTTQAAQLYSDPVWRDSADVDLLVPPGEFGRALDALVELDFVASYPPVPGRGFFRKLILGAVRDVMLVARADPADSIELHRRLFFAGGRHANFVCLTAVPGAIPVPGIGPDLAFYLIAHGALSYWVRLKWLVDLVPLFASLSPAEQIQVRDKARLAMAENSLAASLLLLEALFPFAAIAPLKAWLDEMAPRPPVQRRLGRYIAMLERANDRERTPLSDAWIMLEATNLLFEAFSTRSRILVTAPLSSAVRRAAGRFYPAERSLTLS